MKKKFFLAFFFAEDDFVSCDIADFYFSFFLAVGFVFRLPALPLFSLPQKAPSSLWENVCFENLVKPGPLAEAVAYKIFPYDTICHPQILQVKKLVQKNDIIGAIDKLENIYYEEWLAIIDYSIAYYPIIALRMLEFVAEYHYDDAWRFNAIQKLVEYNYLKDDFKEKLLITETDFDTRELLLEYS